MQTPYDTRLPPHLRALKEEIEGYARGYGLDFYETIFEVIDADDLNEVAAYGGGPPPRPAQGGGGGAAQAEGADGAQLPRAAGEGRAAVPDRARPAEELAARRAL